MQQIVHSLNCLIMSLASSPNAPFACTSQQVGGIQGDCFTPTWCRRANWHVPASVSCASLKEQEEASAFDELTLNSVSRVFPMRHICHWCLHDPMDAHLTWVIKSRNGRWRMLRNAHLYARTFLGEHAGHAPAEVMPVELAPTSEVQQQLTFGSVPLDPQFCAGRPLTSR